MPVTNHPTIHPLDDIRVATPCRADWEKMEARDEQGAVRFCQSCHKNVYNVSLMSHDEAWSLIQAHEGNICVRFARRGDGTLVSGDCPVGLSAKRRRRGFTIAALLAVLIPSPVASLMKRASANVLRAVPALAALEETKSGRTLFAWLDPPQPVRVIMGRVAFPVPPPPVKLPANPPPSGGKP